MVLWGGGGGGGVAWGFWQGRPHCWLIFISRVIKSCSCSGAPLAPPLLSPQECFLPLLLEEPLCDLQKAWIWALSQVRAVDTGERLSQPDMFAFKRSRAATWCFTPSFASWLMMPHQPAAWLVCNCTNCPVNIQTEPHRHTIFWGTLGTAAPIPSHPPLSTGPSL